MKIKQEKKFTLPQLIEWGFDNDIREKSFIANKCVVDQGQEVHFNAVGIPKFSAFVEKSNTFTVEVEEEIMEDTEFKELICLDVDDRYNSYDNVCVLDFKKDRVRAIYIPNDDLTLTLIWTHEKGLVE